MDCFRAISTIRNESDYMYLDQFFEWIQTFFLHVWMNHHSDSTISRPFHTTASEPGLNSTRLRNSHPGLKIEFFNPAFNPVSFHTWFMQTELISTRGDFNPEISPRTQSGFLVSVFNPRWEFQPGAKISILVRSRVEFNPSWSQSRGWCRVENWDWKVWIVCDF